MFNRLDIEAFKAINNFAGNNIFLDRFGIITAKYSIIVFIGLLAYLWFKSRKHKSIILFSGYSAALGLCLNFLITRLYFRPRPFMEHIGRILISHAPETSFPSDHTTLMLSSALVFLYFERTKKIGVILSLLGIVGGLARVFCGLHFPFDILGSALIALISSGLIFLFKNKLSRVNKLILGLYYKILGYEG
jgi:undecaprenyl-diphosphatase